MAFEKGKKKTGGRKTGTPNKLTGQIRDLLKSIYEVELENIPDFLEEISVRERLDFIIRITPYILPKLDSWTVFTLKKVNFEI